MRRGMPVGKKAMLVHLAIWTLFFGFGVSLSYKSQLAASVTATVMILLMTWSLDFACPRCGHGVGSHPIKWLHDFPSQSAWDVFYRRCRWCGHDLRA
jgi:hypothetical protein